MGPDILWVIVFSLGGAALGLVTSLVGLKKGRELWLWLALFAFMLLVVLVLRVEHPFWTILAGSGGAGVLAATIQTLLMRTYRSKNPWFEPEMRKPAKRVALGFFVFALTLAALFGVLMGAVAWGLHGLI